MTTKDISIESVIASDLVKHISDDIFCSKNIKFHDCSGVLDLINASRLGEVHGKPIVSISPGVIFGHLMCVSKDGGRAKPLQLGVFTHDDFIGITCSFSGFIEPTINALIAHQYDLIRHLDGLISMFEYAVSLHDQDYKQKHLIFIKRLINIQLVTPFDRYRY